MSHSIVKQAVLGLALLTPSLLLAPAAHAQATLSIGLAQGVDRNNESTYIASVTNTSSFDAAHLTVTYTLPAAELPISPAPSGGCLFTPGPLALTAVCQLDNLPAHQAHDFVIAVHPVDTASQDVTAIARADGTSDVSAFTTSQITAVGLSELMVTLTSTNPGKVREQLVYEVTVLNVQDDDARDVVALLALPKNASFVSATRGCTAGTLVTCKLGQMSPGVSKTVTITVLPNISGWTQATAGVRASTPDRDPTNNSAASFIWVNP